MSDPRISPYPGLRPFRMDEDYLFFGREEQTAELVKLLREHRFLAVVGRSGSGKSSLVRAGLLPAIQGGMMQHAGSAWEIAILRPGGNPIRNLAKCLLEADLYDREDDEALLRLLATLNHSAFGLVQAFRQSELVENDNLLIVVDQFEELFRYEHDDVKARDEAHAFVELLLEASQAAEAPIYIILTMRSDYLGDCAQFPGLAQAVNRGEYLIPRLERGQLRAAIEGPAKVGGGSISYRLSQHLLNEIGDEEDQLPVLQHALMRTWAFWQSDGTDAEHIDLAHYESIGGMKRAISNHADEVFGQLSDERQQLIAERLFRALTVLGDDNRGVRRPTRLDQLAAIADQPLAAVKAVIDAYRQQGVTFLMPGEEVELQDDTVIDLSHESLMRVWQRLRRWVGTEAQSARIYRRLVDTADLHAEGKAGLYHDPDLEIALAWREKEDPNEAWANQYGGSFNHAMTFLDNSEQQSHQQEQAAERARQRELEQAQALASSKARAAVQLKRFMMAIGAACVLAIGLAIWAMQQSSVAKQNAQLAKLETNRANKAELEAREAAAEARSAATKALAAEKQATQAAVDARQAQGKTWVANAKLLAESKDYFSAHIKAARALGFEGFGRQALEQAKQQQYPVLLQPQTPAWTEATELAGGQAVSQLLWKSGASPQHLGNVVDVARHPRRNLLASTASGESIVRFWDTRTGEPLPELETGIAPSSKLAFSPDGRFLVAASNSIRIFAADDGDAYVPLGGEPPALNFAISQLAFSHDGNRLALADVNGNLYLWKSWKNYQTFPDEPTMANVLGNRKINCLAFHPGMSRLLALGGDATGEVLLLDVDTGEVERLPPVSQQGDSGQRVHSIDFSSDGRWLVVGGERMPVTIWNIAERKPWMTLLEEQWRLLANLQANGPNSYVFTSPSVAFSPDSSQLAVSWRHLIEGADVLYYPESVTVFELNPDSTNATRVADIPTDDGTFRKVCFNHLGDQLFLARAGRLQAWDLTKGQQTRGEPAAHSAQIRSLVFSPDGLYFASGDFYGFIRIWDARTGSLLHTFKKHWGEIQLEFSADGSRLFATGNKDRLLTIWDTRSGKLIEFVEFERPIIKPCLSADRKTLLVGGWYGSLFAYDAQTLNRKPEIRLAHGNVQFLFPDGKHLAVIRNAANEQGPFVELTLHELQANGSAEVIQRWLRLSESYWEDLEIHPNGRLVAIVFQDGSVKTLEKQPDNTWILSPETKMPFRDAGITEVQFDRSGRHMITGTQQGQTKIWDMASEQLIEVLPGTEKISSMALSPDGELLVTGDIVGGIKTWKLALADDRQRQVIVGTQNAPHFILKGSRVIAYAPKRQLLFSTGQAPHLNDIIAWHTDRSQLSRAFTLKGHEVQPGALAVSPDERYLVSGPALTLGQLILWDLESGQSRKLGQVPAPSLLTFSPNGELVGGVAMAGPDSPSRIDLWDVATSSIVASSPILPRPIMGLAFTPDGSQLISATSSDAHPVQFWKIDRSAGSLTLADEYATPPGAPGMKLALSHDGSQLAVALGVGGCWVWDLTSSNKAPIKKLDQVVYVPAFSPDGRLLATGGLNDHLRVQNFKSSDVVIDEGGGTWWDVVSDLVFDAEGKTLFVSRNDGSIMPISLSASNSIPPALYDELFNLDEASGGLVWNDRNTKLSMPSQTTVFSPIEEHYLTEIADASDLADQERKLFEYYLYIANFRAAESVLLTMEPVVASSLRERLVGRLADQIMATGFEASLLDGDRDLAMRLFSEHPESLDVRIARSIELGNWKQAGEVLLEKIGDLPALKRLQYTQPMLEALEVQISSLVDRPKPFLPSDAVVPPQTLLVASTLNGIAKQIQEAMTGDVHRGFSASVEKPAGERVLERLELHDWKMESMLNELLDVLRRLDPNGNHFAWRRAFDDSILTKEPETALPLLQIRVRILEYMELYEPALATADARLEALEANNSPAATRETKSWSLWKEALLSKMETAEEEVDAFGKLQSVIP